MAAVFCSGRWSARSGNALSDGDGGLSAPGVEAPDGGTSTPFIAAMVIGFEGEEVGWEMCSVCV